MNKRGCFARRLAVPGGTVFPIAVAGLLVLTPLQLSAQAVSAPAIEPASVSTQNGSSEELSLRPLALIISGGDLLDVEVFNTPELSGRIRVDQFGNLPLPVGGSIHVEGLTAAEAGQAIAGRLKSARIMLDPHVSVAVMEYTSQLVTVIGEVKKSGQFPLYGSQSLYDVLASAGGLSPTAGGTITISHRNDAGAPQVIQVRTPNYAAIEHTTQIRPGDTVFVSQADLVYTIGALGRQGSIPMTNGVPLTLMNVLSLSSGISTVAKSNKSAIVRTMPDGKVVTIHVDVQRVLDRKDPDIAMQANDILVVPTSTRKYYTQLLAPIAASAVISGAVYSVLNQ